MNNASRIAVAALGTGFAGWVVENTLFPRRTGQEPPGTYRWSHTLGKVPILPIYAAGGGLVAALSPHLQHLHPAARALTYAGALGLLEATVGWVERSDKPDATPSWDYEGNAVDLPHALAWGALALGVEEVVRRLT